MKNMKIKLLSVMISALLCSHLWAQGSESAGHNFTIKMNDEQKTTINLKLLTENGKRKIKSGLIPSQKSIGYTAFFIDDDGKYYIYEHDKKKDIINDWTDAPNENLNELKEIYSKVKDIKYQIMAEEKDIYLTDVGYTEIKKANLNAKNYRNQANGFDKLYVYNKKKGVFVFALYPENNTGNVKIIAFRDTKAYTESYKDEVLIDNFITWLKKTDNEKIVDTNLQIYKQIAQLINESLVTCIQRSDYLGKNKLYNLYTDNDNLPIRKYVQLASNNNKSVFFNQLFENEKQKQKSYIALDSENAKKFAEKIQEIQEYITSSRETKNVLKELLFKILPRDSEYDIEKHSIVISDVTEARKGDIILYGNFESKRNGEESSILNKIMYGIIIDNVICNEKYGSNQIKSLSNLSVAILNPDSILIEKQRRKFKIEKNKFCKFWENENKAPDYIEIRRPLKHTGSSNSNSTVTWDLFNTPIDPTTTNIEIGIMKENTQFGGEQKYRWIPNTGEYLNLEQISINAKNLIGQNINGKEWIVTISGAIDRDWDETKKWDETDKKSSKYGNIYNNSDCKFEVVLEGEPNKKLILTKSPDTNRYQVSGELDKLYITGKDNILYKDESGSNPAVIQIRPENAKNARPGDDLILTFNISSKNDINSNKNIKAAEISVQKKDYIAVYDKKLLWRANLYITEGDGNIDWNVEHPWNAPADSSATQNVPSWWKNSNETVEDSANRWGYNEWNKRYNLQNDSDVSIISNLNNGDGTQVVDFSDFTPLRPLANNNNNFISNVVAYSYPKHPEEPSKGMAGSMDSPFDFIWKLNQQKKLLASKYLNSGEEKNNNSTGVTENDWSSTKAPQNKWTKYEKGNNLNSVQSFMPSLGLFYEYSNTTLNESNILNKDNTAWNWKLTYEAGTDCVGFAQRAASYDSLRIYTWAQLPYGIMEIEGNKYRENVLNKYNNNRNHVRAKGASQNSWDIININSLPEGATSVLTEENFNELKKIVPGDIFSEYGCVKAQQETSDNGPKHIAIIASIPENLDEYKSIEDLMNNIVLIESTFTNKIQSVIKVQTLYDYYMKHNESEKTFYNQKLTFNTREYTINCGSFAVRRLFCQK